MGGLTGAALLIRKLRNHDDEHEDDEEYDDEDDDEDEPRSRHEEQDEDDEDDDEEQDDEDEPYGYADDEDDEDEDEEDDEPQARRSSSRSGNSHGGDRGIGATLWDAVVEGVRSSQSARSGKSSRSRGGDRAEEEDDVSDRKPRGATKTERARAATRASRGSRNGSDRHGDGGEAMGLVRRAKRHLVELTGHEAESVSGIEHDGDGRTRVRLEVLELERIPRTTDVLASYELTLDKDGRLVECARVGRYSRSNAEAGIS